MGLGNKIYIFFLLTVLIQPESSTAQFLGFKKNEYQTPFSLTVFDFKAGIEQFNHKSIETLIGVSSTRLASVYTLDFAKFNFTRYFWKQSMVDLQTGFSVSYLLSIQFKTLPAANQPANNFIGTAALSPRVLEYNLNETFNYSVGSRLLLYGQISYGYAQVDVIRSEEGSSYLKGTANPLGIGMGVQILLRSHESSRVGLGFEFKFTDLRVKDLDDPEGIYPFNEIDLSHFGATVTLGMIFGGRKTEGDRAEKLYKAGKYIDARAEYTKFLRLHPSHARAGRARRQITESDRQIPGEMYAAASVAQAEGNHDQALALYDRINSLNTWDFNLSREVSLRQKEIARIYFENGLKSHVDWDFPGSERWFIRTELIDSSLSEAVRIAKSEMFLTKAKRLIEEEKIRGAESLLNRLVEMNPDLRHEAEIVYSKIARILFEEGIEALNRNAYIYAKDSFERSVKYNKDLRKKADFQIAFVEEAIAQERISEAKKKHAEVVAQNKRHLADRLIAGVDKDRVLRLWGMPAYKYYVTDGPVNYELWVYQSTRSQYYYLYFSEDRLHSWETAAF